MSYPESGSPTAEETNPHEINMNYNHSHGGDALRIPEVTLGSSGKRGSDLTPPLLSTLVPGTKLGRGPSRNKIVRHFQRF